MNSEQKNLAYWFGLTLWPLDAACRLVCGADPDNPDQAPLHLTDPATRPDWVNLFHHATADVEVEIFEGKGGARGVKPGQFIAWARSKGCGLDTKFDALLANSKPAAKVEAGAGTSPSGDWTVKARAIADRLALGKYQRGEREITARNICEAVAIELAKDSTTHGNRGERSGGNIRNEALTGWKFIPSTGTNGTSGTKK